MFARAELPLEAASSRLELATALVDTRPEVALAEARAALASFEAIHAQRQAAAAAALLRSLGTRPASPRPGGAALTKREAEVLELLGLGLSNPEIADRLFISRKTVEHHVSNLLAKLGLRGRAEAAAYAGPAGTREQLGDLPDPWRIRCRHGDPRPDRLEEAMTQTYDAIVVGARCAGAPTAMLLAQRGYRVLLVDKSTFPSDTVSTHLIHAPGVAALRRWGLLDAVVDTGCPPIESYSFDFGPIVLRGTPLPADGTSVAVLPPPHRPRRHSRGRRRVTPGWRCARASPSTRC